MTTLKISLLSALATLFLLVGMLASTGTASAHTASAHTAANCQPQVNPACAPQIKVLFETLNQSNFSCKVMEIVGSHFAPGQVTLQARRLGFFGGPLRVTPRIVTTNEVVVGSFWVVINICGFGFGSPHAKANLVEIDSNGVQSDPVVV